MMPGDVLLLFTDGMIEAPGRDMSVGLDRLLGEVERTVHRRQEGFARDLVDRLGARGDDCALVVVTRSPHVPARPGAVALERRHRPARFHGFDGEGSHCTPSPLMGEGRGEGDGGRPDLRLS